LNPRLTYPRGFEALSPGIVSELKGQLQLHNLANLGLLEFRLVREVGAGQPSEN
jgi:hypothetical protein